MVDDRREKFQIVPLGTHASYEVEDSGRQAFSWYKAPCQTVRVLSHTLHEYIQKDKFTYLDNL